MAVKKDDCVYHECMQLTSQFKFCPMAFRVDMYRGCNFGCRYCFANMEAFGETGTGLSSWREAEVSKVRRMFELALATDKESKSTIVELLRNRVPIHCGGMSDPFQSREWQMGLTKELIKISKEYNYPILFSTKTHTLPDEYFELLDPKIHAFQISIMGASEGYVRKWEWNTASVRDRVQFVNTLREKGFWCAVRIQPIIEVDEAKKLMHMLKDTPSYYCLEHLHVIADSYDGLEAMLEHCKNSGEFIQKGGVTEFKPEVKEKNVAELMEIANSYGVKCGAADNDLHYMSQSRCCCGTDLIGGAFDNYLKFNSCYLSTGESDVSSMFIPKSNVRRHMNIGKGKPTVYVEDVVKQYIRNNLYLIPLKYRKSVEKQLFGNSHKRLF